MSDQHDNYVERHEFDEPELECPRCELPADRCGCAECPICGWQPASCDCVKCDACSRSMPAMSDDGICIGCAVEWAARHQLRDRSAGDRFADTIGLRRTELGMGVVQYERNETK